MVSSTLILRAYRRKGKVSVCLFFQARGLCAFTVPLTEGAFQVTLPCAVSRMGLVFNRSYLFDGQQLKEDFRTGASRRLTTAA